MVAVPVTDTRIEVAVVSMPLPLPESPMLPHVAVKLPEIDALVCDVMVHTKFEQLFGSGRPGTSCVLQVPTMVELADDDELSDWLGAEKLEMC
jgi:hypothetical protein